jgi:predicted dehydrogenase
MEADSNIRVKRLGEPPVEHPYVRENVNFAGDCVYALQRHFVDCLLSGRPFESSGEDYLHNVRIVEAAYESAQKHASVRLE